MSNDQKYTDLLKLLSSNHIEFGIERTVGKKETSITGLWKYVSPIMKDYKMSRLKELLDENIWDIQWIGNDFDEIRIKLK